MKLIKTFVGCLCLMAMASCGEGNKSVKEDVTMDEGKNAVIETIMARRSIRKYKDETVSREVLDQIMECVMVFLARAKSYDFSAYDCGLMAENMMLSAWSLGVGSICLGSPVRMINDNPACAPILERLGFSEGYEFCLCVGLGYADEAPAAKPRDKAKVKYVE